MFHCCDINLTCKFHRLYGVQDFKSLALENYLADFNETYTHYRGGYVKLTYQFSSNSKFLQKPMKYEI